MAGTAGEIVENKQIIFKGYIEGTPKETDMELRLGKKIRLEAPKGSGAFLVKNLYLSCDPYMRGRMRDFHDSYLPPFVPGSIRSVQSGRFRFPLYQKKVVDSDNPNFKPGDIISGFTGWEEYSLIHETPQLRKVQPDDMPLSYYIGLLGKSVVRPSNQINPMKQAQGNGVSDQGKEELLSRMPGFTAYVGFYEVCAPKKNDYVFVSAASGAVGQLVGQLAKLHGCYVVGSTGSSQKVSIFWLGILYSVHRISDAFELNCQILVIMKVDLLKNKLGFDDAFNYKEEPNLDAALKRYFPQGIDIYFENVGGAMLEAVLLNMRIHGRIAVCGMVSQHGTSHHQQGIRNMFSLITKRVRMEGFLQSDYLHLFPRFLEDVTSLYKEGKITYLEDMKEGLENGPCAFAGLFSGENVGKQVICVAS
ncbi:hypothetical protein OROGR_025950 [Orobanche gracilis]